MKQIFAYQSVHLAWLLALLVGLYGLSRLPGFWEGEFLGVPTRSWVILAVANAVTHQTYVWLCWRLELHGGLLTRALGRAAFPCYAVGFTLLILARPLLVTALAIANAGTLPLPAAAMGAAAAIAAAPAGYTFYSVKRYFGFARAMGLDHFDAATRSLPLVRQGIFRFSSNAMYTFGFLVLWIPGLALRSVAALAVALFCHLYIWVHFFVTEMPDMERIRGRDRS